eukprot:3810111-Rhodomonas_salina.4
MSGTETPFERCPRRARLWYALLSASGAAVLGSDLAYGGMPDAVRVGSRGWHCRWVGSSPGDLRSKPVPSQSPEL